MTEWVRTISLESDEPRGGDSNPQCSRVTSERALGLQSQESNPLWPKDGKDDGRLRLNFDVWGKYESCETILRTLGREGWVSCDGKLP